MVGVRVLKSLFILLRVLKSLFILLEYGQLLLSCRCLVVARLIIWG